MNRDKYNNNTILIFCSLYLNNKIYTNFIKTYNLYNNRRKYDFFVIAMFFYSKNLPYNTPYFYKTQHPMNE